MPDLGRRASTPSRSPTSGHNVQVRPDAAATPRQRHATLGHRPTCSSATTGSTTSPTTSASPRTTTTLQRRQLRRNPAPTRRERPRARQRPGRRARPAATPSFEGRDNANQIALQDGIPAITNQYLFQPIAGAFYAPCADGDFDMSVFGHEYTHADLEPHGRRARRRPHRRPGRRDGRELVATSTRSSTCTSTATRQPAARTPGRSAPTSPATSRRHPQLRAQRQPAQLQRHRLRHHRAPRSTPTARSGTRVNYDIRQALVKKYDATFPSTDTRCSCSCAMRRTAPAAAPTSARATGAGSSSSSTRFLLQQGDDEHARRPRRAASPPTGCASAAPTRPSCGTRSPARHGRAAVHEHRRTTTRPDAGLRLAAASNAHGDVRRHDAAAGQRRRRSTSADYEARVTPVADTDPSTGAGRAPCRRGPGHLRRAGARRGLRAAALHADGAAPARRSP